MEDTDGGFPLPYLYFYPTHAYVHNQLHYISLCLLVYLCYCFFKSLLSIVFLCYERLKLILEYYTCHTVLHMLQ